MATPVPDAVAPPPGNRRFPLLDGMRAIAVLSVVLVHVAVFSTVDFDVARELLFHLNIGVTIFFLISGFVLYRPFIAHRAGGPAAPRIGGYAKRRLLRILPAYWLALTVLTALPGIVGVSGGDWVSQYSLLHTLSVVGDRSCLRTPLDCGVAQTWSLAVEFTFYAALPLYALLAERMARGRNPRSWLALELILLAAIAIASVILRFRVSETWLPGAFSGTTVGYMLWFGLGMGLALVSVWIDATGSRPGFIRLIARRPSLPWAGAIAGYVVLSLTLPATPFLLTTNQLLVIHLGFGAIALMLMLPAVFGDASGGLPRRFLANRVVAWLGLVSYGIFLWHYVVTLELGNQGADIGFWPLLTATLGISIVAAAVSYYGLERPLLRFKYPGSEGAPDPHPREDGPAPGRLPRDPDLRARGQ